MAKKYKSDSEPKAKEAVIIGYIIPDLTKAEADREEYLTVMPVFSSEKGVYNKALVSKTMDEAKAKMLARYGREQ